MADKNDLIWQRISQHQDLLKQARACGDRAAEGRALDVLGHCYLHLEMWQEAGEHFALALPLFQQSEERCDEGNTLLSLGNVSLASEQAQTALPYFESALLIARAIGTPLLEADSLLGKACAMNALDRYTEALASYQEAFSVLRTRRGQEERCFNAWGGQGIAQAALGQRNLARESFEQALALARALGNMRHEAHTLASLAHVFLEMDAGAERSLDYLGQALALFRQVGDKWNEAKTLADLGENRLRYRTKARHLHDGLEALNTAHEIASQVDDRVLLSYVFHARGRAAARLGHPDEGLGYIQKALAMDGRHSRFELLTNAGKILFDQGQPEEALKYHRVALMRAFEGGLSREEEEQLIHLAGDYLNIGNFEQATSYYERALRLSTVRDDYLATGRLLLQLASLYYYGMHARLPKALALWRIGAVYVSVSRWKEGLHFSYDLSTISRRH